MTDDVELVVVSMAFEGGDNVERLLEALARYVVLARGEPGCRNIDLCYSQTRPGRVVVIEKWESSEAQQAHFDAPVMVEMAKACREIIETKPEIDLLGAISAHDLE